MKAYFATRNAMVPGKNKQRNKQTNITKIPQINVFSVKSNLFRNTFGELQHYFTCVCTTA